MSDHMLSQEEVDALLHGGADDSAQELPDLDAVARLFQSAFDRVAPLAPPIAGQQLQTGEITVELLPWAELRAQMMSPLVSIWRYEGALQGVQLSVADTSARQQLKAYLADGDAATVLNKLALALAETLVQTFENKAKPDVSSFKEIDPQRFDEVPLRDDDPCVVLQMSLRGEKGDVSWLEVVPAALANAMVALVEPAPAASEAGAPAQEQAPAPATGAAAPSGAAASAGAAASTGASSGAVTMAPATFAPLAPMPNEPEAANIGLIMDVPLHVTVELGRRRMLVREVLELGKGSLIELDKLAGEPVDVLVNGKLIAKGEVVVIDENFGVKVTTIITPAERLQNLQ